MQPENPAEFGARVYEMMGLALAGKNKAQAKEKVAEQGEKQTKAASSTASETPEVVEASEVITENDPWQS